LPVEMSKRIRLSIITTTKQEVRPYLFTLDEILFQTRDWRVTRLTRVFFVTLPVNAKTKARLRHNRPRLFHNNNLVLHFFSTKKA
jgi:hypothetical protein